MSEPLAPTGGRFPGLDTVLAGPVGLFLLGVGPCTLLPPAPVGSARFLPDAVELVPDGRRTGHRA